MRDDDLLDALLERAVDDRERVVAGRGARWRGSARAGRSPAARRASRAAAARPRRSRAPARRRARALAARAGGCAHCGTLSPGFGSVRPAVSAGESTVGIQTMRAPSRAAISTASAFIPPTAWFSVSVPTTSTPGTSRRDDLRPLGRRGVVRLEREAGEPELREAAGERHVVDPPRRHVGADVDVQVVRALRRAHARARSASTSSAGLRRHRARPYRSPAAERPQARRAGPRSPPRSAARSRARAAGRAPPPSRPPAAPRACGCPRPGARAAARRSPPRAAPRATRAGLRPPRPRGSRSRRRRGPS